MREKPLSEQKELTAASHEQLLRTVCAWLVANLMRSEDVQSGLLGEQRLAHLFRQRALEHLLTNHRRVGNMDERTHEKDAVSVFLEPLASDVAAGVPAPQRGGDRALSLAEKNKTLLRDDSDAQATMRELYGEVLALSARGHAAAAAGGGTSLPMEAEVIQEVEAEAEAEEEQEQGVTRAAAQHIRE